MALELAWQPMMGEQSLTAAVVVAEKD